MKEVEKWTGRVCQGKGELYYFLNGKMVHMVVSIQIPSVIENLVEESRKILG
jgi:hypothetical protein